MSGDRFDVIIVGAGTAGLAAARHALRAGMSTALVEKAMFGGLVLNVAQLDGEIPGSGIDFISDLMTAAVDAGVRYLEHEITALEGAPDGFRISGDGFECRGRALIVASGAHRNALGIPGEEAFVGKGLSECADCDGPLLMGEDAVVVGGGDSALQSALTLAQYCRHVHVVHRAAKFDAAERFVEKVRACGKISVHWRAKVAALLGTAGIEAVRLVRLDRNDTEDLPCRGVFAYVGLTPNTSFLPAVFGADGNGGLPTDPGMRTRVAGAFAAGAVRQGYGGTISDAQREGIQAAEAAVQWLRAAGSAA